MRFSVLFIVGLISWFAVQAQANSGATCRYWAKDYDSPGFGIPYRSGFFIRARFGCQYRCVCPRGSAWIVTHVLEEKHFDANLASKKTGGPNAAKWFICPQSVKTETWKPVRDLIGHVIAWQVEPNYDEFPVERVSSPEIQAWAQSCN
ncbi:MAG: hypothetical protein ACK5Y2_09305 [Bdellovibrionales bacterium]